MRMPRAGQRRAPPLNCGVRRRSVEQVFEIAFRVFGGVILLFFAFAPAWILADLAKTLVLAPSELDLTAAIAFLICAPLLYFLLLLAYRAFTGRGRKGDGGLLPPWALKGFAVSFGLIGVAIAVFGAYQGEPRAAFGVVGYLGSALALYSVVRYRARQRNLAAGVQQQS
jgi:hypothetical protein